VFFFNCYICFVLMKCWVQHLEAVIRSRIPSILAMINKTIDDIEAELNQIGRPLANDAGVSGSLYTSSLIPFSLSTTMGRFWMY